ncbi:MAG: SAM-dependent methyltransferase [Caulobacterales bacterium]
MKASVAAPSLRHRLIAQISAAGPMSVADFMRAALYDPEDGYYVAKSPIGAPVKHGGDFITAPEVSQMFGELLGLWAVQAWADSGAPDEVVFAELGPGRGVLMADALWACRVAPQFRAAARVHLVELNSNLKAAQMERLKDVPHISWLADFEQLPPGSSVILANEFLDCFPIRQFARAADGWRERLIGADAEALQFGLGPIVKPQQLASGADELRALKAAPEGAVYEVAPGFAAFVDALARRLLAAPGRALFVDYGGDGLEFGDTLQALKRHKKCDPLLEPGCADLTAHVDFRALCSLARGHGLEVAGPMSQGAFLHALGIGARAQVLIDANPHRKDEITKALERLTGDNQMGRLFKAVCISSPGLPAAAGF